MRDVEAIRRRMLARLEWIEREIAQQITDAESWMDNAGGGQPPLELENSRIALAAARKAIEQTKTRGWVDDATMDLLMRIGDNA